MARRGRKWLINWVKDCHEITDCEVVTIDSLAVWGSHNKLEECSVIHVMNAFVIAQVLCLNNRKLMIRRMSHGNFKLLEFLDISGHLVPNGAKGYQKKIAQKIVDENANYMLVVKDSHGLLEKAIREFHHSRF
ncbi:TPA: ISAs1 family transposase [Vibrio parahaemolyticus]|nr:ISAs1 family transposase [Vibrio parahaemolyticus]HAS6915506.1 ISAs1 family transposase [Vibrio parahaemolyticus]HAS6925981.1 ISAs1 family transposase [Vibrio parahaemolyticus]